MKIPYEKLTFDVVVLGGGAAGSLAAIRAKKLGADVAFVTKESALVGGATIMAGGGTSLTQSPGDNGDVFFKDIMKSGQQINDQGLVHLVADNCMNAFYDLENCDLLLDRDNLKHLGSASMHTVKQGEGHAYPRAYLDRREALGFCHGLAKTIERLQIPRFTETIAVKILKDKDGKLCGLICYSVIEGKYLIIECKALVMATGGLGALYEETTNSTVLSGTGFALAFDAGTELKDMEMVQFMPLCFPYPKIRRGKIIGMCSLLGPSVKLYNGLGERYMHKYDPERKEFTTRDIGARGNYTEIKEGRGNPDGTITVDNRGFDPAILNRWKTANPFRYRQCVQTYGKKAGNWEEPFEAIPAQHFFMGGIKINTKMETGIPGLFAVGECTAGVHGANRLSGVAFAEIFSLGPIAGQSAFDYLKSAEPPKFDVKAAEAAVKAIEKPLERHTKTGYRPFEIKQMIQHVVSMNLGPVRVGPEIEYAIKELERIREEVIPKMTVADGDPRYSRERLDALEVPLMVETALMVAKSAAMRTESRGSHYRTDYPDKDPAWLKNVVISRGADGGMQLRTEAVAGEVKA
ncbi:MAG: FAD-binding protein [Firmicutes bacterium]|nr:FAD-binding protein [Bacillota bacterium]